MTFDWTADRIGKLTELWTAGFSASEVAKQLGGEVSRYAVIGKTRRLKLPLRAGKHGGKRVMSLAPKSVKAPQSPPKPSVEEPVSLRIPFAEAKAKQCRWISNHPSEDSSICGHETKPLSPYCYFHAGRTHQPATHIRRETDANA